MVARAMKQIGIRGAVRGKMNRVFRELGPNFLLASGYTYVLTWQGFVYVAFAIDTFADRIVGWRISRPAKTNFVLDALGHAPHRDLRCGGMLAD